MKVIPETCRVH